MGPRGNMGILEERKSLFLSWVRAPVHAVPLYQLRSTGCNDEKLSRGKGGYLLYLAKEMNAFWA